MRRTKMFTGLFACVLALSSAMAVSAADYVEYGYTPDFKVDFEKFIYEAGQPFPLETAGTASEFKYSELELNGNTAKGSVEVVDAGAVHGKAVKVNMSEATPGKDLTLQTATNLLHTYNSGKITVKYDMLIPEELDADMGENVFVQVVTTKTDVIGKMGNGGNIEYPVNEWFTVTANYYLSADNKSGKKEILFTDKSGKTTVILKKADMPANNFFNGLIGGGITKLRFITEKNQNHSFLIDNICITSLPGIDADSGEYVLEARSKGTGDFLVPIGNKGSTYYASGIGGKDYTVTRIEAAAATSEKDTLTSGIQTRDAFKKGVFIDDYVEYNSEYYFPTHCDNVSIFTQIFSTIKKASDGSEIYGISGANKCLIPWEINSGKIGIYSNYPQDVITCNPIDIPVNEWFTIKTKIIREDGKVYFAVDVIMQSSGNVIQIVPKTLFDWEEEKVDSSTGEVTKVRIDDDNVYLANGIFALRESMTRIGSEAVGPFYIGNKSLMKAPAYEIGDIAFTDDEDVGIKYIDGNAGINATVNAVDYAGSGMNVMLWCAAYDENDQLIDVKIKSGKLPQGTPDIIKLEDYFEIPQKASYFKAGLADDNMTPLTAFGYLD